LAPEDDIRHSDTGIMEGRRQHRETMRRAAIQVRSRESAVHLSQWAPATDEERLQDQRRQTVFCYLLATVVILFSDFHDCKPATTFMVDHKFWIVVYLQISFINLMREHFTKKINDAYDAGTLTYK